MQYRRAYAKGATYFFTANLLNRNGTLLTDYIDLLKQSIRTVKNSHPFHIDAIAILPDHIHTLWTLPDNESDFPLRWRLIKSGFSKNLPKTETISASRRKKGERGIWQRRFWEHLIRNEEDFANHVNYIHINPVKHGYVQKASDWRYTSIHKYIRTGILSSDWGCSAEFDTTEFGEIW